MPMTPAEAAAFRLGLEAAKKAVDKMWFESIEASYRRVLLHEVAAAIRALPVPPAAATDDDDPVTMAIAALKCSTAKGNDLIAVLAMAEVALAYLTGHGGDYTAYREAQDDASAARGQP